MAANNFSINYRHILLDEIALNGLEGIGLYSLWNRVEKRISSPVTDKLKARLWRTIVSCDNISFYQNPEPAPRVEFVDRFTIVHEETGHLSEPMLVRSRQQAAGSTSIHSRSAADLECMEVLPAARFEQAPLPTAGHRPVPSNATPHGPVPYICVQENYLDGEYEYHPIKGQYGSSAHFHTRIPELRDSLLQMSYEQIANTEYGDRLVMVASIEERWRALADHRPISLLAQMNPMHYCILELVGKGRENGQITQGKSNLLKIVKDSKFMFYSRNFLQKLDLIRAQHLSQRLHNKLAKTIILRLKRFHQSLFLNTPKTGKLRTIINYLMEQPDHSEKTHVMIENGLITGNEIKRLQKTVNVFDFEERMETLKIPNRKGKTLTKKRYITLTCPSETESGDSDNEAEALPCQYKVGVNVMRQAYELLIEAGLRGLTQIEIGQLLGLEFYASRTICKALKANNIVREFLEDKGRQRTARYIAVSATTEIDGKYKEEKQKLLNYMSEYKTLGEIDKKSSACKRSPSGVDAEVPKKKPKTERHQETCIVPDINVIEREVTEVKVLEGLENFKPNSLLDKRNLTLRQLKFANGLFKVLKERLAVSGYCTLSTLVAKETNEPPMDSKRLKMFLQKLIHDGQVKVLRMKWPGANQNVTHFLCAPHVKATDQVIVTKYRELCLRVLKGHEKVHTRSITAPEPNFAPVFMHKYPKYMKIQKLHELLTKIVYFERENTDLANSSNPEGVASMVYLIPEMTVEFAMSHMPQRELRDILQGKIDKKYYDIKLKDAPFTVNNLFFNTPGLQDNLKTNLKILSMFGLIQLIREPNQVGDNVILSYAFYVNRHASIVDTTGKWPRAGQEDLEKKYYFETFEHVQSYWQDVHKISTNTTIQLKSEERQRKKIIPTLMFKKDVKAHDNGARYGDGRGPCGFDATFFMDVPRQWSTLYCKLKKKQPHHLQYKQQPLKTVKKEPKIKPRIKRAPRKERAPRALKPKPQKSKPLGERTRKRVVPNAIKWTNIETKVVMLSKAAITVMSPVAQPGSLRVRNAVLKAILTMSDPKKCGTLCHLKALALEANSSFTYEKECLINELRRRESLMEKYDGLLKKIRSRYPGNLSKFMHEAQLPMLELMWVLYLISKSESFNKRSACAALDYEQFHTNFSICPSSANKALNLYQTPLDADPKIAALKEGMITCVMLSFEYLQSTEMAQKVYTMFSQYPEATLRVVIDQMRKCGAVAAREKLLNNVLGKVYLQEIVQSSYKISAFYQRRWICRLNSDFVENLNKCLDHEMDPPEDGVKGSPEINCFAFEMYAGDILEVVSVSEPFISGSSGSLVQEEQLSVMEIFTNFKLKTGNIGWTPKLKAKKFADVFDDIKIEDSLTFLARDSTLEITKQSQCPKAVQDKTIISHLVEKKSAGSTFRELQKVTGYDSKILIQKLQDLESENVIKRIGYYENIILLTEFAKPWTLTLDDKEIIPTPWLKLEDDQIRYDIFVKWAAVIVNTVFMCPGCSITFLAEQCEMLTTRSVQDVCVALEKFGCVKLNVLKDKKPDMWADDDVPPQLEDFNPYEAVANIVVSPVKDSLTRFAYVKNRLLEEYSMPE